VELNLSLVAAVGCQLFVWRDVGSSRVENRTIVNTLGVVGVNSEHAADWSLALAVLKLPRNAGLFVHLVVVGSISVHFLYQSVETGAIFTVGQQ